MVQTVDGFDRGRPAELYVRSGVDELRRPILRPERPAPQGELWSER